MRPRLRALLLLVFAGSALAVPAGAEAQFGLGQLGPAELLSECGAVEEVQLGVASGPEYEVPEEGAITSWSANAGPAIGKALTFKVLRATEEGLIVIAHDGPRQLEPGKVNTFKTAIPVEIGDLLSIGAPGSADGPCLFNTGSPEDEVDSTGPFADAETPDGFPLPSLVPNDGHRLNLRATFLESPEIAAIGPSEGPLAGGTPVVLGGFGFAEVQGVTFGDVPAKSIRVSSEGQMVAVAPPSSKPGEVPVVVRTAAGLAAAPEPFYYFRPSPRISAFTPPFGAVRSGTTVTIAGSNFAEVESVSFGGTPALSYKATSESRITAVAPPSESLVEVPVEVTTAAGSATAAHLFAYDGCLVPQLTGRTLKFAGKLLKASGCQLGKVKKRFRKAVKASVVVGQSPAPEKVLAPGAKVDVKVLARPAGA